MEKRTKIGNRFFTYPKFQALAALCHEQNYAARGERYATPDEMRTHRSDPLACAELVYDDMAKILGVDVFDVAAAVRRVWRADFR